LIKIVANHIRDWAERLPEVVLAFQTTWKTTIGFSPFELIYGKKAFFPIEFEI